MMTKKRIIILGGIVVVIGIIIAIVASSGGSKKGSDKEGEAILPKVFVDNLGGYEPKLGLRDANTTITDQIQAKLEKDNASLKEDAHAKVRDGSFKTTTNEEGIPYHQMLVDLPSLKRTYKVTLLGGDDYEQEILYVNCPDKTELVYPEQPCKGQE